MKKEVSIENAKLVFKNFEGKEGKFNRAGDRNFCILLDDPIAQDMQENGWNVKFLQPREEGDKPQPYIQVKVNFNGNPSPNIFLVSSNGKNRLTEDDVKILDWADIATTDVVIRPYDWEVNGKTGRSAYLKTLYVVIVEDEFEKKYANTPDSAENTVGGCGNCDACDGSCHE